MSDYNLFAEIWDPWTAVSPQGTANRDFYVKHYVETQGPVVELGIGTGRVAIEACKRGKNVIGIDDSAGMLERCRQRARTESVLERMELIQSDVREFAAFRHPPDLVTMPFRTLGCFHGDEERLAVLEKAHRTLNRGGTFICDHFVFHPGYAQSQGLPRLRTRFVDERTQRESFLWFTTQYFFEQRRFEIVTWTDEVNPTGIVSQRKYRKLECSWIDPANMQDLLEKVGFRVRSVLGGYDGRPFSREATEQIWIATKR